MEHKKKQNWDQKRKAPSFNYPQKSGFAGAPKASTMLITNNFKIQGKNTGVIYTYKVDFLEGAGSGTGGGSGVGGEGASFASTDAQLLTQGMSNVSLGIGSSTGLETFQKFRIMNAQKEQLKKVFIQYVFVGNNLFSTEYHD
jgi:hypothetical protein